MPPVRMTSMALICCGLVAGEPAPLSLRDAIHASLLNNLQVQIAKETREFSGAANELIARGAFDWNLTGSLSLSHIESTSTSLASKTQNILATTESTTNSHAFTAGISKPFEWGGSFSASYSPSYSNTSGVYTYGGSTDSFSSSVPYSGTFSATYTQSLLKGFGRDVTGANLIVAQKGTLIADYAYQKAIIDLVASTESAYWDVVYALRNLENKQQALALAQKQLKENRIRVEVGTLAPIEVTSAEATVALREQEIISAEVQVLNAKDALIRMLYPQGERPGNVEPTDAPTLGHLSLDEASAIKMALERRVELKSAQLDLESKQVLERAALNRTKPQLDAFATYSGGSDNYGSIGPVNADLTGMKNPGYIVGLQFSMSLANHAAKGALSQARASARSSELSRRDQELAIILEVRQTIRNVEAAEKTVKASEKTRVYREKDLDAEQKKFDNGMSTNFLVLSKQNDLDSAKATEVQSQISYAKAVTAFEKSIGNLLEARIPNAKLQ
ncbi:TolC family protein [Holophaga foetida]|uniref:TolC family protein n=1 Tax=Holophaga foetida TaxID=35839 RepID=UPI0002473F57|nr:TolC family protein [Holophaga foetida]